MCCPAVAPTEACAYAGPRSRLVLARPAGAPDGGWRTAATVVTSSGAREGFPFAGRSALALCTGPGRWWPPSPLVRRILRFHEGTNAAD